MKKLIIVISIVFITSNAISQEFMGIAVEGSRIELINKFKAKGFTLVSNKADENSVVMNGKANNIPVELYISFTPLSNKCWSFAIYLPKHNSWYSLKNQYNEFLDFMIEKYGKPIAKYDFFIDPYYEGDGYELSALKLDKCKYAAIWENYLIEISEFYQVKIQYENTVNSALMQEERKRIDRKVF